MLQVEKYARLFLANMEILYNPSIRPSFFSFCEFDFFSFCKTPKCTINSRPLCATISTDELPICRHGLRSGISGPFCDSITAYYFVVVHLKTSPSADSSLQEAETLIRGRKDGTFTNSAQGVGGYQLPKLFRGLINKQTESNMSIYRDGCTCINLPQK